MASKETKSRILAAAVSLFNEKGMVNVRLQHISDFTIISLGNITYHFKTKDDIVLAIWDTIKEEQKQLLAEFKTLPLFEDIDRYIQAQFLLQRKYLFFYLDMLEVVRAYPEISKLHRKHIIWQESQLINVFNFNIARGAFLKFEESQYKILAENWMALSESWLSRQNIKGEDKSNYKSYNLSMWSLLRPYMTEIGNAEFEQLTNLRQLIAYE